MAANRKEWNCAMYCNQVPSAAFSPTTRPVASAYTILPVPDPSK